MRGKTWDELQAENRAKVGKVLAEQSALRVQEGKRAEQAFQSAEAVKNEDRARVLEARLKLRETDPLAWHALNDGLRLEALRWESERQGRGGRQNRDSQPQQYSGFVDPRYARLRELAATDPGRYETELGRLSPTDKINFSRWLAVQGR